MDFKAQFTVTDLSHNDLVTILSDATYGNPSICVGYQESEYKKVPSNKRNGFCLEDKCADILLNGGIIEVLDGEAEDISDVHSDIPREACELNGTKYVLYYVTLQDILNGMSRIEAVDYVIQFINGDNDMYTGYSLMQVILFGEVIYG